MTKDSIAELEDMYDHYSVENYMYVRAAVGRPTSAPHYGDLGGLENGRGVVPGFPSESYEFYNYRLLPVYEVEWIDTDKENGEYI